MSPWQRKWAEYPGKSLEELEKPSRKVISISLNEDEQAWLRQIQKDLDINDEGRALKTAAKIGTNVIHSLFTSDVLGYIFSRRRVRLSQKGAESGQNVGEKRSNVPD